MQVDLQIFPILTPDSRFRERYPGLYISSQGQKVARGRKSDRLVVFFSMFGNFPLTVDQQQLIASRLSRAYFKSTGAVTTALQKVAEACNKFLLDRNLRNTGAGKQSVGLLTLVLLRKEQLFIAQAGASHTYILGGQDKTPYQAPDITVQGLGLVRGAKLRFVHLEPVPGQTLVISHAKSPGWTFDLLSTAQDRGDEELNVFLRRASGESGQTLVIRPSEGTGEISLNVENQEDQTQTQTQTQTHTQTQTPSQSQRSGGIGGIKEKPHTPRSSKRSAALSAPRLRVKTLNFFQSPIFFKSKLMVGSIAQWISTAIRNIVGGIGSLFKRVLPDEGIFHISSTVMLLSAIAVPLLVVTFAGLIYSQQGKLQLYQDAYRQAQNAGAFAISQTEPDKVRSAWLQVLVALDQAEKYQKTQESQALRDHANQTIDELDAVQRLDFSPLSINGIDEQTRITRILSIGGDLFFLDSTSGKVHRAFLTGIGYQSDPSFSCEPGPYGAYYIGNIIDIIPIPSGNDLKASLIAMDSNGNLMYCIPGEAPLSAPLPTPDSNWGNPIGIALDMGKLYVLDPKTNAVWIYQGSGYSFRERPHLFFDEQVPSMKDVIDFVVNQSDLYLLHADGHMGTCAYSTLTSSPTRCTDPSEYTDWRPGRESGPKIQSANITQMLFTPPPEPSIYLLDPIERTIYHFSLRMTLQRLFKSRTALPDGEISAFYVSSTQTVFLAIGNRLFSADIP